MCSAEHASLAAELQQQLQEQIESLAEIEEALAAGHADEELLAVKQQLEEAIPALRDSLQELAEHQATQPASEQADVQPPEWLRPGAICRFRYQNGQWYHGLVEGWQQQEQQQQQQLQVQVQFRFPTRAFMLHSVQLPLGLVLQGSSSSSGSAHRIQADQQQQQQQQQQLTVGSRVFALVPGQQLWQQAEITSISQAAAAAAAHDSAGAEDHHQQQQQRQGGHACTVLLVDSGQSLILPLSSVALSCTAAVTAAEIDARAAAAAAGNGFNDNGSKLDMSISIEEDAGSVDEDGSSSSSGFVSGSEQEGGSGSASEDDNDDDGDEAGGQGYARVGLGGGCVLEHARLAAEAGVQSETASFAAWEHSGRGIASKLMAAMGFRRGGGLGRSGTGIANPLEINILPSKKGLGAVPKKHQHHAAGTSNKPKSKKGRGGERSRRRKAIAARHAVREAEGDRQLKMEAATGTEGVFAFINYNLGSGSEAADKLRDAGVYGGRSSSKQQTAGAAALASVSAAAGSSGQAGNRQRQQKQKQQQQQQQQPDRQGLVGSGDNLAEKKARVAQLSAMLQRNKGNKGLAPQIEAKLAAAQREVDAAAAQHRQLHKAVAGREATKKWMKF